MFTPAPSSSSKLQLHPSSLVLVVVVHRVPISPYKSWYRIEDEWWAHINLHWCQLNWFIQYLRFPLVPRVDVHLRWPLHLDPGAFRAFVVHVFETIQCIIMRETIQFYSEAPIKSGPPGLAFYLPAFLPHARQDRDRLPLIVVHLRPRLARCRLLVLVVRHRLLRP